MFSHKNWWWVKTNTPWFITRKREEGNLEKAKVCCAAEGLFTGSFFFVTEKYLFTSADDAAVCVGFVHWELLFCH